MLEKTISTTLRIQLIEKISVIDLPAFIFAEIDHALSLLNCYKLQNLLNNSDEYCVFLHEISHSYIEMMLTHTHKKVTTQGNYRNPEQFMNTELTNSGVIISMHPKDLLRVESTYRVNCLLRMKEYINRRVFKKSKKSV